VIHHLDDAAVVNDRRPPVVVMGSAMTIEYPVAYRQLSTMAQKALEAKIKAEKAAKKD